MTVAVKNLKLLNGKPVLQKQKKLYDKLARMGFSMDMAMDVIRELNLAEEPVELSEEEIVVAEEKVMEKLIHDYQKYERQYLKKGFVGRELENRIIRSLMGRKYPYEMIKDKLREMKEEKE
jgi:regulatory protein